MNESLMPFNSTQAERNLSLVMKRSSNLPVDINDLWNPFRCPENLLPWLAWSLSVDNWNSAWPTPVKRQQIANSIEIHRRKGTVSAVKKAMAVFGVQVDLSEWFETKSTPHTFSVMAWAGDNFRDDHEPVLTEAYYDALKRAIDYSKPVRSHYEFNVGAQFESSCGFSSAYYASASLLLRCEPELTLGFIPTTLTQVSSFSSHALVKATMEFQ